MSKFKVHSSPISKLDKLNLHQVWLYNVKKDIFLEIMFCGNRYTDNVCFAYHPEVHLKEALALDEERTLKQFQNMVSKGLFLVVEGDLKKIEKEVRIKKIVSELADERGI